MPAPKGHVGRLLVDLEDRKAKEVWITPFDQAADDFWGA